MEEEEDQNEERGQRSKEERAEKKQEGSVMAGRKNQSEDQEGGFETHRRKGEMERHNFAHTHTSR